MNGKKLNSQEALKKARRVLREQGISTKRKFVSILCKICNKEIRIQTSNKLMYTEEVRKNFACLLCESKVRKQNKQAALEQQKEV